jgi:GNAT superfamily N-acetyltransferase
MALMSWWKPDTLPKLPALPGFAAYAMDDDGLMADLNQIDRPEVRARRRAGHTPYVATLAGSPVAYGWSAARRAEIGELGLRFALPRDERYLWDFATLPGYRGLGLYPRLLQVMVRGERAARAWIIHAPENLPSGAGMSRAGFSPVGRLALQADGAVVLADVCDALRARWGADLLGVEFSTARAGSCWRCARGEASCGCWRPGVGPLGHCSCATPLGIARRKVA